MKGHQFISASSVIVAIASVAYAAGNRTAQTAQPVTVTNTTAQCVPTSIYHSIVLPVKPGNTITTPLFTKDSENPGRIAYEQTNVFSFPIGTLTSTWDFPVPSGYRFLIRSVEGWSNCGTSGQQPNEVFVEAGPNGNTYAYWGGAFVTVNGDPHTGTLSGNNIFMAVNGSDQISVIVERQATNTAATAYVTVAGELVPTS